MPEYAPNPYLPDKGQQLAALLMSMGQGITASDMAGRGVLPGLGLGAGIYGASQQQAQQDADKAWQWQQQYDMQQEYRKAQEESLRTQNDIRKQDMQAKAQMGGMLNGILGFGVPQTQPTMGPSPDLLKAGPEKVAYLQNQHGLSPVAAAGVVGNLYQESGFNPNATHDGGRGYGMAGWDPQRTAALQAFAQSQGKAPSDPQVQLDFVVNEGKSGDMGAQRAWQMLQTAKTPEEATTALMHYFRPAGYTPNNPQGGNAYAQRVQYSQALLPGGAPAAGGNPAPASPSAPSAPPQNAIQQLDPAVRASIAAVGQRDPEKAMQMLVTALQNQKKEDAYEPLNEANAKMYLGQAYDPTKAYQRNKITGKIEPIGGSLVNINNQQESEFTKKVAQQDAETLGGIQSGTRQVVETANKVQLAADLLKNTYTGPGANYANEFFKTLGAMGVESAANKANAATAATALISELTPKMRVAGSGATSDFEMRTFAAALPSLLNMPGGNEMVAQYWQRIADRALAVQGLAEKHAAQSKGLTGTPFAKEVKDLGPLFTKEEIAQMQGVAKAKPPGERKPLDQFGGEPDRNMSPMPAQRKPLNAFGGQ